MPIDLLAPLSFKQPIDINLPSNLIDLFGRFRVSSPETQVQIRQDSDLLKEFTISQGFIQASAGMSVNSASGYTRINTTGGGGKYRLRSRICGLYQNGKSILIFFTFNFNTTGTANVIKRAGYFRGSSSSMDGIYLEQNGTTLSWNLATSISGTKESIAKPSWSVDPDIDIDITKAQIGMIAFEYLGVGDAVVGFVQDRQINITHIFSHKNELLVPYMATPNLFLSYEIDDNRAGTANPQESITAICATCLLEGGQQKIGYPFSITRWSNISLATNVPTMAMIFRTTTNNSRISIDSYQVAFGANATVLTQLFKLDTVGTLGARAGIINGVEYWLPSTAVTFTGIPLNSGLATQSTKLGGGNVAVEQFLDVDYDDTYPYYAIILTSSVSNLTLQSVIVNLILES